MKSLPPHDNVITLLGCVTKSGNLVVYSGIANVSISYIAVLDK